jgi:Fe-S cluster assembly protein SufB
MPAVTETIDAVASVTEGPYKYGFETDIEMEFAPKGLSEEIVRFISAKKNEPEWLLEWRLKAYAMWLKMEEPAGLRSKYPPIDYQDLLLRRAEEQAGPEIARRGRSRTAEDL